jgi:serine/threonine-protein kinase RIO1
MDTRTRLILYKLLNAQVFDSVSGVISSGKEANVYYAQNADGRELAIKIYRTTLNEFKHRDSYIRNNQRFRHKVNQCNPRKLIKIWAEKEWLHLNKLRKHGVPCPETVELRKNVLVMAFLGKHGTPAPKLRAVALELDKLLECYKQCIRIMRKLYQHCKLVHADLSEYNILYVRCTTKPTHARSLGFNQLTTCTPRLVITRVRCGSLMLARRSNMMIPVLSSFFVVIVRP